MSANYNTESFIVKAKIVHGDKYNYSKTNYISLRHKVIIICPVHGEFEQWPIDHIKQKSGCPKCSYIISSRKSNPLLTTEQFVERSKKIHSNKFDYSKSIYTKAIDKVIIICPVHGEFEQRALDHMRGNGCNACRASKGEAVVAEYLTQNNIKFTREYKFTDCRSSNNIPLRFDFYLPDLNICIEYDGKQHFNGTEMFGSSNADDVLDNIIDRDKIKDEYCKVNNIKLIRVRPWNVYNIKTFLDYRIHNNIVNEETGIIRPNRKRLSLEEFIEKSNNIHNKKYNYSKVKFGSIFDKSIIICPEHGEFEQEILAHTRGSGCRLCGIEKAAKFNRRSLSEFIEKAQSIHGDRYNYSKVIYKNQSTKVNIICRVHGEFMQLPIVHINQSSGCPKCAKEKLIL